MDAYTINQKSPRTFILACDGHNSTIDPKNDQVWELGISESGSNPFYLHTTYNLRARSMRLEPNFVIVNKPDATALPNQILTKVLSYCPASLVLQLKIKHYCEVIFECFLPQPDTLIGYIAIENLWDDDLIVRVEMACSLAPMEKGAPMRQQRKENLIFLNGLSDNLAPVLVMTGAPSFTNNPAPALTASEKLASKSSQAWYWTLVTKQNQEDSLNTAKNVIISPWQIKAQNYRQGYASKNIIIQTGLPAWDTAIALSQTQAILHQVLPAQHDTGPQFINTRLPNQPIEAKQYEQSPDEINAFILNHLSYTLLPSQVEVMTSLLDNHLNQLLETKNIKKKFKNVPILAKICLSIFEINQDKAFLERAFPILREIFTRWVPNPADIDNHPGFNWDAPEQLLMESGLFTFDTWEPSGQGLDIRIVESPALVAMLFQEAQVLEKIASILADKESQSHFSQTSKAIKSRLQTHWQNTPPAFIYQDTETGQNPTCEQYYSGSAGKNVDLHQKFSEPQRLICHLIAVDENTRSCTVILKGKGSAGEQIKELFKPQDIRWSGGRAHLTTKNIFRMLDKIEIIGLKPKDQLVVESPYLTQQDISCLLPLLSGGLQNKQVDALLETVLDLQNPDLKHGLPEVWHSGTALPEKLPIYVNVLWNTLIIEGLTRQGKPEIAAALFTKLMETSIKGLIDYEGFFPCYHAENGKPSGKRNAIAGLLPVRLLLKIAGIQLFTPNKIAVWQKNPFPWPINVHWQGLSLRRDSNLTEVTFANGAYFSTHSEDIILMSEKGIEPTK